MIIEQRYEEHRFLFRDLAVDIIDQLDLAIVERGCGSLVLSGGSTPAPLYEVLSHKMMSWEMVWVALSDERWVPVDDPESNEGMAARRLLVHEAARSKFVGLKTPGATPEDGWQACEARLAQIPQPFDVVVLGMGNDGHMASLFPGAPELPAAMDLDGTHLCHPVHPPGPSPGPSNDVPPGPSNDVPNDLPNDASNNAPTARMSLTLPALRAARRVYLLILGQEKWYSYHQALGRGPVEERPIRALLHDPEVTVRVYWAP